MARTDIYLDAMLRHLGAAYYDSLHGQATHADVTRALDTVEEHLAQGEQRPAAGPKSRTGTRRAAHRDGHHRPGHWKRRVRDVMTTSVVTVDRITPYKEIARLLTEHRISGVPVLTMGRQVAGVVSEADLLAAEDEHARRVRGQGRPRLFSRRPRQSGLTAEELMTAPAVTITPDMPVPAAARLMTTHRVRRLPVIDPDGKLIGIVTRRDLLSVFLRPDDEIAADVSELLEDVLHVDPASFGAVVRDGRVILTGTTGGTGGPDDKTLVPVAIQLIWDVDGVVDVVNRLDQQAPEQAAKPKPPATPRPADQVGGPAAAPR